MSTDFTTCTVTKAGNIIIPKARMGFPALLEAREGQNGGKPKFSSVFLVPSTSDISILKKAVKDLFLAKYEDEKSIPDKAFNPLKQRGRDKVNAETGRRFFPEDLDDWFAFSASSVQAPGVVGPDGKNVTEGNQVYSGRWCRASIRPFWFEARDPKNNKIILNRGVSFGLQNVQLLDNDEQWGGMRAKAEDEFEPVGAAADGGKSGDSIFD